MRQRVVPLSSRLTPHPIPRGLPRQLRNPCRLRPTAERKVRLNPSGRQSHQARTIMAGGKARASSVSTGRRANRPRSFWQLHDGGSARGAAAASRCQPKRAPLQALRTPARLIRRAPFISRITSRLIHPPRSPSGRAATRWRLDQATDAANMQTHCPRRLPHQNPRRLAHRRPLRCGIRRRQHLLNREDGATRVAKAHRQHRIPSPIQRNPDLHWTGRDHSPAAIINRNRSPIRGLTRTGRIRLPRGRTHRRGKIRRTFTRYLRPPDTDRSHRGPCRPLGLSHRRSHIRRDPAQALGRQHHGTRPTRRGKAPARNGPPSPNPLGNSWKASHGP